MGKQRELSTPDGYPALLAEIKARIAAARSNAARAANRELIGLYYELGHAVAVRVETAGWGRSVVERLAADLKKAFPDGRGYSARNLWRMVAFYRAWSAGDESLPQAVAEIPWGHNAVLLESIKERTERLWYAHHAREHGWSRATLVHQIESRLHTRQGKAVHNFEERLPEPQSALAEHLLKDPYLFGFLDLEADAQEREIERALLAHVRKFLLELGLGFAYVGNQYHLQVGERDFYIDLLFYHLGLRCFVVIELKAVAFEPEPTGKLNFYMAAVDAQLRDRDRDGPTIGLLLCKSRDRVVVEYALQNSASPIGVSEYRLAESLPDDLRGKLPTVDELEAELDELGRDGPGDD